ncbi:helix-turn-helix transcriptional regulator [Flavobacterium jejuense]|uniref:Helix-turn-helix transcriptional regulator n=1 Tax=Flavobacterium jejuense TaxID=1544455 RepID=A0ABX0IR77_9FLAO|nr:helix-turn-helix transcriptional regulator [Flavobacterium jejuense]NHN26362.1 helix-turn-helix transcriptional regulator [Flavobacterium jejuense]
MKKDTTFKSLLLSQEEIALLLGIKRSQYAMYEIGKRDLPTAALLKLSKLTNYADTLSQLTKREFPYHKTQQAKKQELLLKQIENNNIEQLLLEKKIKQLQHNYQKAARTIEFVTLYKEKEGLTDRDDVILENIQNKALAILDKNGVHLQTKIQLQLKALLVYTKQLEKELWKG